MSIPFSVNAPDRFTPEALQGQPDAPVYLISIPTVTEKPKYRRAMAAAGVRIWNKEAMIAAARSDIAQIAPANADALMQICDRYEAITDDATPEEALKSLEEWAELSRVVQSAAGAFAAKVADNTYWQGMAPLVAARCFFAGAEGTTPPKREMDGLITADAFDGIPEDHIYAIGNRALELMWPSVAAIKNSESPRPSPSDPALTISAPSPRTADQAGKSSAKSTGGTPS